MGYVVTLLYQGLPIVMGVFQKSEAFSLRPLSHDRRAGDAGISIWCHGFAWSIGLGQFILVGVQSHPLLPFRPPSLSDSSPSGSTLRVEPLTTGCPVSQIRILLQRLQAKHP